MIHKHAPAGRVGRWLSLLLLAPDPRPDLPDAVRPFVGMEVGLWERGRSAFDRTFDEAAARNRPTTRGRP